MNDLECFNDLILSSISKIQRLSSARLENELKAIHITLSEFRIVGLLLGEAQGYSQKELAKLLRITPASLSVAIQKLEDKTVIKRISDASDQRVKRIRLSSHVDFTRIHNILEKLETRAVEGIQPEELMTAKHVLKQVLNNMVKR